MELVCNEHPKCIEEQEMIFNSSPLFGELDSVLKTFKLIESRSMVNELNEEYISLIKSVNTDKTGYVLNILGKHYYSMNNSLNNLLNKMISFYCFYVSAELNNMDSMAFIGNFYSTGIYQNRNKEKAFSYYLKSVQPVIKPEHIHHRPSVIGFFWLGLSYKENTILPTEIRNQKIFECFSKSIYKCKCENPCNAERNFCINPEYEKKYCYYLNFKNKKYCIEAIYEMGLCYLNAIGVERNIPKFLEYIDFSCKFLYIPSIMCNATYHFQIRHLNLANSEKALQLHKLALFHIGNQFQNKFKKEIPLENILFILKNVIQIFQENQVMVNKYFMVFLNMYLIYFKNETDISLKDTHLTNFKITFTENFHLHKSVIIFPFLLDKIIPLCYKNQEASHFIINTFMDKKFWSYKNRLIYPPSFNARFNLIFLSSKRYQKEKKLFLPIEIYLCIFEFLPYENWKSLPQLMN